MSRPLRVDVNLTWLGAGRVGGSEEYLVRQLTGLPADGSLVVRLLCQRSFPGAYPELAERFACIPTVMRRDRRPVRILAEHTWLAARTRTADVVHHGGGTAPLVGRRPLVLTVHDLQYRRFPGYFSAGRRRYLEFMMPRSVERAAVIAVPTGYVRGTVVDAFGVAPERVVVVPHGVPQPPVPPPALVDATLERYGLTGRPFVIYPAITHPHKGHRLLVEMLDGLDPEIALVLIGGEGDGERDLAALIGGGPHGSRVIRPGRVPTAERDALIAAAAAMAFPSEYEGFGAPCVEAMALGTPVVCSAAPALVEVVGEAGIVVAEPSGEAWSDAVRAAIGDADRLVAAGAVRRRDFTPDIAGRALAAAYRQAVDS